MEAPVTWCRAANDRCAEFVLGRSYAPSSFFLTGYDEGTCADRGFTEAAGTDTMREPFLGPISVSFFKKPIETVGVTSTLYGLSGKPVTGTLAVALVGVFLGSGV